MNNLEASLTFTVALIVFMGNTIFTFGNADAQPVQKQVIPSHGTVNILLADEDGLVAVTDSMLTAGDTHTPDGRKLFKLDDRTICMMAGAYRQGGAMEGSPSVEFLVPAIMDDFKSGRILNNMLALSFEAKATSLFYKVAFEMTANYQALASDSIDISMPAYEPLYLTLAGYDLDGTLKVAELAFVPARNASGAIALPTIRTKLRGEPLLPCEISRGLEKHSNPSISEDVRIRKMGEPLFCEAVGLSAVAEQILSHPDSYPHLPQVVRYAEYMKGGHKLTTQEMKELALELENQTAIDESKPKLNGNRVGGTPEIAVLKRGNVDEFFDNPLAEKTPIGVGVSLSTLQFQGMGIDCARNGVGLENGSAQDMLSIQTVMKACTQHLDGFNFHDSEFTDSNLFYFNTGQPFEFADNNVVTGSTLTLGQNADMSNPRVKRLVCHFQWKTILKDGKPFLPACDKTTK